MCNLLELAKAGIVLTGNSSNMKAISLLAERVFGTVVRIGGPTNNITGIKDIVNNPKYSTGVGLLMYSHSQSKEESDSINHKRTLLRSVFNWFKEKI